MTQPTKWSAPLGSGADVQDLPDDDLRYASFSKIFPQITQVPLSAGGVAPRRVDFNSLFKLLADNIYYYQNGGVFEYSDTSDYEKGALVRYNDKIYLCIQDNSALNTHNPEDMNYWLRVALNNELGVITGKIEWFAFNTPPEGYLVCNGASVSRATYSDLFTVIGTTFGSGDGSTTFTLPDLRDRYVIGANTNALGTQIAEQLPNILGSISAYAASATAGIFAVEGLGALTGDSEGTVSDLRPDLGFNSTRSKALVFNASRSNSVYKDSGKVYPLSLALLPCIKY